VVFIMKISLNHHIHLLCLLIIPPFALQVYPLHEWTPPHCLLIHDVPCFLHQTSNPIPNTSQIIMKGQQEEPWQSLTQWKKITYCPLVWTYLLKESYKPIPSLLTLIQCTCEFENKIIRTL
jgi:hypothetical protein